jgi:hypothetical protein
MSIDVAIDSDDFRQPMLFQSPAATRPRDWTAERRGVLQEPAGLGEVVSVVMNWPNHAPPAPSLRTVADATILELAAAGACSPSISLVAAQRSSSTPVQITLPVRPK